MGQIFTVEAEVRFGSLKLIKKLTRDVTGCRWKAECVWHVVHQRARRQNDVWWNVQVMKDSIRTKLHRFRNCQIELFCSKNIHYIFLLQLSCRGEDEDQICSKCGQEENLPSHVSIFSFWKLMISDKPMPLPLKSTSSNFSAILAHFSFTPTSTTNILAISDPFVVALSDSSGL